MTLEKLENFKIDEHLAKALKSLQEKLNKIASNFDINKLKNGMENQIKVIKRISKYGFLIPSNADIEIQKKIFNCKDNSELEMIYLKFFNSNNKKELINLKTNFYNHDVLNNFRKIYKQAYFNFNCKNYYASCIVLTSLLEGLIRKYASVPMKNNNLSGRLNANLNSKYSDKYTVLFQDKTGISKFIENYYISISEDDINDENYFNRNALMHGLEFNRYKKIDAIKLFNVIDILNSLLLIDNYEVNE